jgi:MFS transporter, SP family, sugar:H+ symporter
MYIQGVLPWKSSEWVAPPPEEIARIRAAAGTGADEEIARAAMNDNIQPAPEKESLDSDESADHQEKVAEREAEQARENEAAAERRE